MNIYIYINKHGCDQCRCITDVVLKKELLLYLNQITYLRYLNCNFGLTSLKGNSVCVLQM